MVQKGVYPYEYTDDWKRFSETSLPEKEDFYNSLMEDTTDGDYKHAKRTWEDFEIKNKYHNLYVRSNTLFLATVFENFQNISFEIKELDPTHFLTVPGLASQAALKKTKVKLELLTDADM